MFESYSSSSIERSGFFEKNVQLTSKITNKTLVTIVGTIVRFEVRLDRFRASRGGSP